MVDALASYMSRAIERPFAWGGFDCFMFPAEWELEQTGIDLPGAFRGTYDTERQARRLIMAHGGIVALAAACCDPHLLRAVTPLRGDIGLVRVPLKVRGRRIVSVPAGAICYGGDVWAVKSSDGLTAARFPLLVAWHYRPVTRILADG